MPAGKNQKLKMLYLARIFMEETDDQHALSINEIIQMLKKYDVNADRKTLYLDFAALSRFGLDILSEKNGRYWYYYLGEREFELPELKLLVDSVQSAKFITDRKSSQLIGKLEKLVSNYQAKQLHRQVVIAGRNKSGNEKIFYNVDMIHDAINADRQIRFHYFRWNVKKEMELRKDGAWYEISPWSLMWDDENYYLVGYDPESCKIKHYRVDKMIQMSIMDRKRDGMEAFKQFNLPRYTTSLFGMFGGTESLVTLEGRNDMVGILIDRFGKDITIVPVNDTHFRTSVNVVVSQQFFGWIMGLGDGIKIISPENVVAQIRAEIKKLDSFYSV